MVRTTASTPSEDSRAYWSGGGAAKDAADVVGIGDAVEHDERPRPGGGEELRERQGSRSLEQRQRSLVDTVAGQARHDAGLEDERRRITREGREGRVGGVVDQQRAAAELRARERAGDDGAALGDEEVVLEQELGIADAGEEMEARVVGPPDAFAKGKKPSTETARVGSEWQDRYRLRSLAPAWEALPPPQRSGRSASRSLSTSRPRNSRGSVPASRSAAMPCR